MHQISIFNGISQEELSRMLQCFQAVEFFYHRGQTIQTYSSSLRKIGVLLSGKAHLYCVDFDGSYTLLERFGPNDLFGEMFSLPLWGLEYIVEADTDCEVLFLLYEDIIKRCEKACGHHSQLSDNLFQIITKKSQALSLRINLLTAKTVRQRLLHYLTYQQEQKRQTSFSIDMSLTELAEYLGVDRSSLMREIRTLKAQGVLCSKGRVFSLNPPSPNEKGGSGRTNE